MNEPSPMSSNHHETEAASTMPAAAATATTRARTNRHQTSPPSVAPAAVPTRTGAADAGRVRGRAASTQTFTVRRRLLAPLAHDVPTVVSVPAGSARRLVALSLPPG